MTKLVTFEKYYFCLGLIGLEKEGMGEKYENMGVVS